MINVNQKRKSDVILKSRKPILITCPHCWTDQRTQRNFCYQCGAKFIYLDELCSSKPLSCILSLSNL